jgi:predicted amidohydrolase
MSGTVVKVGAVQAEPVQLDLQGSVEKNISLIQQARKDGVNILGFPGAFGFPDIHGIYLISPAHLEQQ